jgi:hypothetical protein
LVSISAPKTSKIFRVNTSLTLSRTFDHLPDRLNQKDETTHEHHAPHEPPVRA